MNTDHFIQIGRRHVVAGTPCEDYAYSGLLNNATAYAVVSDGCSGAYANTDVGARALVFAFRETMLKTSIGAPTFSDQLLENFKKNQYTGESADYYATIVAATVTGDGTTEIYIAGDGVVLLLFDDNSSRVLRVEWDSNMPYYLEYEVNPLLAAEFKATTQVALPATLTVADYATNGSLHKEVIQQLPLAIFERGFKYEVPDEDQAKLRCVMVCTDGVDQIKNISLESVLNEFTAFKVTAGSFIKRRVSKALAAYDKTGNTADDDIGVSCIWIK